MSGKPSADRLLADLEVVRERARDAHTEVRIIAHRLGAVARRAELAAAAAQLRVVNLNMLLGLAAMTLHAMRPAARAGVEPA